MTIEEAISRRVALLLAGSPTPPTIALDILPQSPTYPAVCIRLIGPENTEYTLEGTVNKGDALIQVDTFALEGNGNDPYADATELAERIHGTPGTPGLSGWRGFVDDGNSPSTALEILGIFREDRRRAYDPDVPRVVSIQQDYRCHYRQPREVA